MLVFCELDPVIATAVIVPPISRITAAIIIMIMFFFEEKPLGMALSVLAADIYSVSSVFSVPQVGHFVWGSGRVAPQFLQVMVVSFG